MRHPVVKKWVSSPDLLIFTQFHTYILKNWTMLFPTNFFSVSEKIGFCWKKHEADFFDFMQRRVARYSCFDFFPVQNEGPCKD